MPADLTERCNPADAVIIVDCIALEVVGALPTLMGFAGSPLWRSQSPWGHRCYFLGIKPLPPAVRPPAARRLMLASLVYLPAVLVSLAIDKLVCR